MTCHLGWKRGKRKQSSFCSVNKRVVAGTIKSTPALLTAIWLTSSREILPSLTHSQINPLGSPFSQILHFFSNRCHVSPILLQAFFSYIRFKVERRYCYGSPSPHSQNHRMLGVGRDLWGSYSPTPLPKQGHLQQAAQDLVQAGLKGDSTTSLGNLVQWSITLRGKKFFLMFRRNFLCFRLCPLPLVLSLGSTEKSLAPSS